jgi:hypothetical protein
LIPTRSATPLLLTATQALAAEGDGAKHLAVRARRFNAVPRLHRAADVAEVAVREVRRRDLLVAGGITGRQRQSQGYGSFPNSG